MAVWGTGVCFCIFSFGSALVAPAGGGQFLVCLFWGSCGRLRTAAWPDLCGLRPVAYVFGGLFLKYKYMIDYEPLGGG